MNITNLGHGAIPDKKDERDFVYEELLGAGEPVDWSKPFNVENKLSKPLKAEHQNGSSSCVGQAWAYYAEVLEDLENKNYTDLSARDIYSRIFNKQGGAYIRDGANCLVKRGVCREELSPSYENGKPPTETFMRTVPSNVEKDALNFKSKSYATLYSSNNIDKLAEIIRDNNGCVSGVYGDNQGWQSVYPKPPKNNDWGHALYFTAYRKIAGKKQIGFINSWGDNWGSCGRGWLEEEYFGKNLLFSAWTLCDLINKEKTMTNTKLIKNGDEIAFYLPATNAEALKAMAKNYGIEIPLMPDGSVDWEKIEYDFVLNN